MNPPKTKLNGSITWELLVMIKSTIIILLMILLWVITVTSKTRIFNKRPLFAVWVISLKRQKQLKMPTVLCGKFKYNLLGSTPRSAHFVYYILLSNLPVFTLRLYRQKNTGLGVWLCFVAFTGMLITSSSKAQRDSHKTTRPIN